MKTWALRAVVVGALAVGAILITLAGIVLLSSDMRPTATRSETPSPRIRIAVVGDSDSQSYHDRRWIAPNSGERGGAWQPTTFQWGEILDQLRGNEIDLGAWGFWGTRRTVVRVMDWFGHHGRTPRKQDFRYNFAFSGATCSDLMSGNLRQVPRLVSLMNRDPAGWRDGVVVIRIGVVSFGYSSSLDQLAIDHASPVVQRVIAGCLQSISDAVGLIRATHPTTRILLIGILDNSDFPPWFDKWQSSAELTNISRGLDVYDRGLQQIAGTEPGIAFFDDRAWFAARWGSRGGDAKPDYKTVQIGKLLSVKHGQGDDPANSVLGDGHAGLVWNALWAQTLVATLNDRFGTRITPIGDAGVEEFIARQMRSSTSK